MTRGRSAALWVWIAAVTLSGAALLVTAVHPLAAHQPVQWPMALLLVGMFVAAERLVVHLRIGREAFAFTMSEVPLVLGLFVLRPDLVVLCRLLGGGLALLMLRRPPRKLVFNLGLFALETSVAALVWYAVLAGHDPLGPRGWLATAVAVLTSSALSSSLVGVAIAIATGQRPHVLGEVLGLGQVGDLANACFALVAVYVLGADWRAFWLLVVVLGVLTVAYRAVERARSRAESLERLNRFTERVGRDVDVDGVVRTVLEEVRAAFRVERVELRLCRVLEPDEDWVVGDDGVPARRPSDLVTVLLPHTEGGSLVVTGGKAPGEVAGILDEHGLREVLMVPLSSVGQVSGSLVVAKGADHVAGFGPADLSSLQSFANHAAVALENVVRADLILRSAEEREYEASHDDLTGLANRRLLKRTLDQALADSDAAVLVVDLDRFKEVNDALGHEIGDGLLNVAAERLVSALPSRAVAARLGGDDFAVVLPGEDEVGARRVAGTVRTALDRPLTVGDVSVAVEATIGLAVVERGATAITALRWADLALSAAKHTGTGLEVYRPELDQADSARLCLLADLRDAVAAGALEVHYQPKVDVRSGRVVGVEALARWTHPHLGPVRPDEFVPLAEHSTLITPLTMLVLRRALADAQQWRAVAQPLSVAVNISPRSLLDPEFVDEVTRALAAVELPASALILEITETNLMADPERAIGALERLREIGVRLSVDDLGTGYSSLAYLQRLPVDEIKIDRSFLSSFDDPSAQAVVGTIVDLGHRLGKQVVAEGVEVVESMEALRRLGCDTAQGYWIARPMPAAELAAFLVARERRTARVPHVVRQHVPGRMPAQAQARVSSGERGAPACDG